MGAINKNTTKYEYPKIASKNNNYICPECNKDVILKKGNIRIHHFAHKKSENPCTYYNNPGESQIHKDAKMAMKLLLESNTILYFYRNCPRCQKYEKINIEKGGFSEIEYKFIYNNNIKIADVAYLKDDNIKYIFEICYKHITDPSNRPEPWFEVDAIKLLDKINNTTNQEFSIECIRYNICSNCKKNMELDIEKLEYLEYKKKLEFQEDRKQKLNNLLFKKIQEMELERLKKIEEEKRLEFFKLKSEKSNEIITKLRSEHKRCSKCKSYERCKKCVKKLWEKHDTILKNMVLHN